MWLSTAPRRGRQIAASLRPDSLQSILGAHIMERKIFWMIFIVLGLVADFLLPFWWAFAATLPILYISWWVAYRSGWF
jgi:hypothetical protein